MTICKWVLFLVLVCSVGCGPTAQERYNTALEILEYEEKILIQRKDEFRKASEKHHKRILDSYMGRFSSQAVANKREILDLELEFTSTQKRERLLDEMTEFMEKHRERLDSFQTSGQYKKAINDIQSLPQKRILDDQLSSVKRAREEVQIRKRKIH